MPFIFSALVCLCAYMAPLARASVLFATSKAWDEVVMASMPSHATYAVAEPELSLEELQLHFGLVWHRLQRLCPTLPNNGKDYISMGFDDALLKESNPELSRVLGWASRTELLSHGTWSGALATQEDVSLALSLGLTNLGTLRVARSPPGGWFRGEASTCQHRFRLEDVLLHELLHLLGVSSSVRELDDGSLAVGSEYLGTCFPGAFDREIVDGDGNKVVGSKCEFKGSISQALFVNGARLYAETDSGDFVQGTSLSHLMSSDAILSPTVDACDPAGTRPLTSEDAMALLALNVKCDASTLPHASTTLVESDQNRDPSREQSLIDSVLSSVTPRRALGSMLLPVVVAASLVLYL